MAKTKYKNKSLPTRQWAITLLIGILIIFGILYIYKWHQVKEQEKYINSYLISSNTISMEMNDINEIDAVLSETANYYFVYIGYTNDEAVYNLEKSLKPVIDKYDLHNNFYYLNVTDIKENNKNYLSEIANKLNIDQNKIKKIPVILYFKDGTLIQDGIYNAKEFEELIQDQDINLM